MTGPVRKPGPGWILPSLRGFRLDWLPRDLTAGLMLAAIALPEQLANARLAGMPPATGLYAFAAGSIAFALLGANRFLSVGADSTIAPILAGGIAAFVATGVHGYGEVMSMIAFAIGSLLILAGLLRAGWLADLLSVPVTTGFLAGIALHIAIGQLPTLLGVPTPSGALPQQLLTLARQLGQANPWTLGIGLAVLAVTLGAERLSGKLPGALIGLVGAAVAVLVLHLQTRGVAVLGTLPVTLPQPALPKIEAGREFIDLVPLAIIVAMICIMQTAAVIRSFPSDPDQPEDISRDFVALGAGNILAGLLGGFAVNASPPRTAVVQASGGRSQLGSIAAVVAIALVLVFAGTWLAVMPQAGLSGVLLFVASRIFRLGAMAAILKRGGYEILLVVVSAAAVVVLPIESGMLLAIVLSLAHSLYILARPQCAVLARVPGTTVWWPPSPEERGETVPGVLVFAPGAPLNFTNASYLSAKLEAAIAVAPEPVRLLVIEASSMIDFDYTGSQALQTLLAELSGRGIQVALARLSSDRGRRAATRTGLIDSVGPARVFHTVEDAVRNLAPHSAKPGAV